MLEGQSFKSSMYLKKQINTVRLFIWPGDTKTLENHYELSRQAAYLIAILVQNSFDFSLN